MPGEVERPVRAARRGWATIPSFGAVRRGALPPMSRRRHVWELIGSLVLGDGRLEPGGHSLASDERQHDFGRVVRQRPAVAPSETECRGRPHYEGQDIGEELPGNGSPVALWVARGSARRDDGAICSAMCWPSASKSCDGCLVLAGLVKCPSSGQKIGHIMG